jgi:segregation and condensation protein B
MSKVSKSPEDAVSDTPESERVSPRIERETIGGEPCADLPLASRIEALLMTSDRPLTEARLAELLGVAGKGSAKAITAAIDELNALYEQSSRAFRAERLAGGWQILTLPAYGPLLHRLHEERQLSRLSQPALESLSIIAYRQPIMRAEIEAIRGVASGEVLRGLLERRLVKIVGRAEELGRPMLYGTTSEFLKVFGLASLDDLPQIKGLTPGPAYKAAPEPAAKTAQAADDAAPEINVAADLKTGESAATID